MITQRSCSRLLSRSTPIEATRGKKVKRVESVLSVFKTVATLPTSKAIKELVRHYVDDKVQQAKGEGSDLALKTVFGEEGGAFATEVINFAQTAFTAAAVAAAISEARKFEQHYPSALKHPEGKHFLLNLEYIFTHEAVSGPPLTFSHPPTGKSVRPQPTAQATVSGLGALFPQRRFVPSPGPGNTFNLPGPPTLRINTDIKAFLYWWTKA